MADDKKPAQQDPAAKAAPASSPSATVQGKREELQAQAPKKPGWPKGKPRKAPPDPAPVDPETGEKQPLTATDVKAILNPEVIAGWDFLTENITTLLALLVGFAWPGLPLSKQEMRSHTKAWSVCFAVTPPTDLISFSRWNLAFVYVVILFPRVGFSVKGFLSNMKKPEKADLHLVGDKENKSEGKTEIPGE